jgi:alpha-ribazole phosphatase
LWLIRHAPVDGPVGVVHPSDAPTDLSATARIAALASALPRTTHCYCSPARRTRDTAAALGLSCRLEPALREQDFGDWIGRHHDEIAREHDGAYDRFWRAPAENVPPGGESFVEQIARTRSILDTIGAPDAVLVVHSGTVRAVLAIALSLAPERALSFVIDPLSLTRVDRVGAGWRVGCVNANC